jgi:hypothetical protein
MASTGSHGHCLRAAPQKVLGPHTTLQGCSRIPMYTRMRYASVLHRAAAEEEKLATTHAGRRPRSSLGLIPARRSSVDHRAAEHAYARSARTYSGSATEQVVGGASGAGRAHPVHWARPLSPRLFATVLLLLLWDRCSVAPPAPSARRPARAKPPPVSARPADTGPQLRMGPTSDGALCNSNARLCAPLRPRLPRWRLPRWCPLRWLSVRQVQLPPVPGHAIT